MRSFPVHENGFLGNSYAIKIKKLSFIDNVKLMAYLAGLLTRVIPGSHPLDTGHWFSFVADSACPWISIWRSFSWQMPASPQTLPASDRTLLEVLLLPASCPEFPPCVSDSIAGLPGHVQKAAMFPRVDADPVRWLFSSFLFSGAGG